MWRLKCSEHVMRKDGVGGWRERDPRNSGGVKRIGNFVGV